MASKTFVTPIGVGSYLHLNTPNTKFNRDGEWNAPVQLTDAEHAKLSQEIETAVHPELVALASQHRFDLKTVRRAATPWKRSKDGKGWEYKIRNSRICGSGEKRFEFTPKLFGADAQPWPVENKIGMGSKIRVSFSPYCWYVKGELGISLRLKAVQVIEAKNGQSAESYGFDAVAAPAEKNSAYAGSTRISAEDFAAATSPSSDETRAMGEEEFVEEFKKAVNSK